MQYLAPSRYVVLLERGAVAKKARGMDQAVELAEFRADGARERVVFHRRRHRQIQRCDCRLRGPERLNLVIDAVQPSVIAARKNDGGAGASAFDRQRPAKSAAGSGNQDRAPPQQRGVGNEIFWDQLRHLLNPGRGAPSTTRAAYPAGAETQGLPCAAASVSSPAPPIPAGDAAANGKLPAMPVQRSDSFEPQARAAAPDRSRVSAAAGRRRDRRCLCPPRAVPPPRTGHAPGAPRAGSRESCAPGNRQPPTPEDSSPA